MTVFAEPDLVRVSILGGNKQLDAGLPTSVPIAALIPDLLEALRVSIPTDAEAPGWTLACVDGTRLRPDESLAQAGILDGDLLMVRADHQQARAALVDDIADGVATTLAAHRAGWTASASRTIGEVLFVLATFAALPVGRAAAEGGGRGVVLTVSAVGATIALAVAVVGPRLQLAPRTSTVLTCGACSLVALATSLVVTQHSVGAQVALAAIAVAVCAVVGYRADASPHTAAIHTGLVTAAVLTAIAGTLSALASLPVPDVAAITAALGVAVILLAPRLSIALARLPLPAVSMTTPDPTALSEPSPVDGVDAVRLPDRDQLGAIADLALGDLTALAHRAGMAASLLTGLLAGAVVMVGISVVTLAATAGGSTVTLVYGGAVLAALAARGRTHADRWQSGVLVAGAGTTAVGAAIATLWATGGPTALSIFVALAVFAVAALLLGNVAAGADYSPPAVRVAEIIEYAVLVALVPLLFWVLDVYQSVRQL